MAINPLTSNMINLLATDPVAAKSSSQTGDAGGSFADILTETFNNAETADFTDKVSALELLTGQTDDMSGLLVDATKAELSLNLAIQIRNRAVDAYNEIIRMQI